MRTYHKNRCQNRIRSVIKLNDEIVIILTGKHAFEYTVTLIKKNKDYNKSITFSNRERAMSEISRLKSSYSKVGDCIIKF